MRMQHAHRVRARALRHDAVDQLDRESAKHPSELFQTIAFFRGDPTKTLSNAREMNPQFNANE